MPVALLLDTVSFHELLEWGEYFVLRNEQQSGHRAPQMNTVSGDAAFELAEKVAERARRLAERKQGRDR